MNPKMNFDLEYWKTSLKTCVFDQILKCKMWNMSRPRALGAGGVVRRGQG